MRAAWRAGTARDIQIEVEGSEFGTPGTTYTYKTMLIKMAGLWEKFGPMSDDDGNDVITGTLRVGYNSTSALAGQIIVVNELTSLT